MANFAQSFVAKYGLSVSASEDSVTNANYFPLFGTQSVGVLAIKASSTKFSFNPSSGLLSASAFAGNGALITNINITNVSAGILPVSRGGSGTNLATGTGNNVLATGPVIDSPTLNNPTSNNANITGTCNLPSGTIANGTLNVASGIEIGRTDIVSAAFVDFHTSGTAADYDARIISSGGSSTTGTGALTYLANAGHTFQGAITSNGDITAFSDERLKTGFVRITGALERVKSWTGWLYTVIESGERRRGVKAQEIAKTGPEYVLRHESGYLTVMYQNMVADLIEAIKEADEKADDTFNKMEAKFAAMEERIKALEAK